MASLSQQGLTTVSWVFTGVAVVLTAGRVLIRNRIIKKFYWDDLAHILALILLIAHTAIYTGAAPLAYQVASYRAGKETERPNYSLYFRLNVTESIVLWCCLWSVKIAFLLFYRLLFKVSKQFIRAWWCILALVVVTFWVCVAGVLTECGTGSDLFQLDKCLSPSRLSPQKIVLQYSCAANVLSDIAIMTLPLFMLKGLQLPPKTKFGLAAIFSCALIIIAFDILRTVESVYGGGALALNSLWTNLEAAIAVIVSCLASFSALFTASRNRKAEEKSMTDYRHLVGTMMTSKSSGSARTMADSSNGNVDDAAFEAQYFSMPPTTSSRNGSGAEIAMEDVTSSFK